MSFHNELVSVVIPVYNSEKFLAESIESVLNQSYKNIEILAVDDGSTDTSLNILKKYSDKITILTQKNQGLAIALNNGLKPIKGKWFKWFSPDDILYPNAIETLVFSAKEQPENTIIYSNWEMIDEKSKKLRSFSESNFNDLDNFEFNIRLLNGQQINVNTALIPSNLLEKGCNIQKLVDPVAIDYDFFLRAGIHFGVRFFLVEKILLKYRIQNEQLSHQNISNSISFLSKVRNEVLSNLDDSLRNKYLNSLKEHKKNKPLTAKAAEFGLQLALSSLPNSATDKILIFYLNKIRRTRN